MADEMQAPSLRKAAHDRRKPKQKLRKLLGPAQQADLPNATSTATAEAGSTLCAPSAKGSVPIRTPSPQPDAANHAADFPEQQAPSSAVSAASESTTSFHGIESVVSSNIAKKRKLAATSNVPSSRQVPAEGIAERRIASLPKRSHQGRHLTSGLASMTNAVSVLEDTDKQVEGPPSKRLKMHDCHPSPIHTSITSRSTSRRALPPQQPESSTFEVIANAFSNGAYWTGNMAMAGYNSYSPLFYHAAVQSIDLVGDLCSAGLAFLASLRSPRSGPTNETSATNGGIQGVQAPAITAPATIPALTSTTVPSKPTKPMKWSPPRSSAVPPLRAEVHFVRYVLGGGIYACRCPRMESYPHHTLCPKSAWLAQFTDRFLRLQAQRAAMRRDAHPIFKVQAGPQQEITKIVHGISGLDLLRRILRSSILTENEVTGLRFFIKNDGVCVLTVDDVNLARAKQLIADNVFATKLPCEHACVLSSVAEFEEKERKDEEERKKMEEDKKALEEKMAQEKEEGQEEQQQEDDARAFPLAQHEQHSISSHGYSMSSASTVGSDMDGLVYTSNPYTLVPTAASVVSDMSVDGPDYYNRSVVSDMSVDGPDFYNRPLTSDRPNQGVHLKPPTSTSGKVGKRTALKRSRN